MMLEFLFYFSCCSTLICHELYNDGYLMVHDAHVI